MQLMTRRTTKLSASGAPRRRNDTSIIPFFVGHRQDAAGDDDQAAGSPRFLQHVVDLRRDTMAMDVPARGQVPHKPRALRVAQRPPQRLRDRAQRIDDDSPVVSLRLADRHLRPHAAEQTASRRPGSRCDRECEDEGWPTAV